VKAQEAGKHTEKKRRGKGSPGRDITTVGRGVNRIIIGGVRLTSGGFETVLGSHVEKN